MVSIVEEMDEMEAPLNVKESLRTTHEDWWIGLLTRQSIVDQFVHTAAIAGYSADTVSDFDVHDWSRLALASFGLSDDDVIKLAVITALRQQESEL